MDSESERLILTLSSGNKVVLLGGMAMIAHGFSRFTKDVDIWLDPSKGVANWCRVIVCAVRMFNGAKLFQVRSGLEIVEGKLDDIVQEDEFIRISGLDLDVDVFFRPNNLSVSDFESVWSRAVEKNDGLKVADEIDLGLTKMGTGRMQDRIDIEWLDSKIIPVLCEKLTTCDLYGANAIFSRIATNNLLEAALKNPDRKVQMLAKLILKGNQ